MSLTELYRIKLLEYKKTGLRDKPHKLLALLLLPLKEDFEPLKICEGDFYNKYKNIIDEKIKQVEDDFNFTKEELLVLIEQHSICDDYEHDKIWNVFSEGFGVVHWGILYQTDKTAEDIYKQYFDTIDLDKKYSIEELAYANDINVTKLDYIIEKIVDKPTRFYERICEELTVQERMFILKKLENKSCLTCTSGTCRIESSEKVGYDVFGKPEGSQCLGWYNPELIGKSKVLKINDINQLK